MENSVYGSIRLFFHSLKHWCGRSKGSLCMWVHFWHTVCKFRREVEWFGHLNRFTWAYSCAFHFLGFGLCDIMNVRSPSLKIVNGHTCSSTSNYNSNIRNGLVASQMHLLPEDIKIMLLWPIIRIFVSAAWRSIGGLMFRMWLVWKAPWTVLKET